MTLDRRLVIGGALALAAPGPARAAPAETLKTLPAKKIFPYYDLYLGIPSAERTRFALAYYLTVNGKPAGGAVLTLIGPGGVRTPLTTAADGRFTRLPTLADFKAAAQIVVEKKNPGDRFGVSMEMQPVLRLAETIAAADVAAAIEQCNTAIRRRAGPIGFAVPKMEQALFRGPNAGAALWTDGKSVALPVIKGLPAFQPAAHPGAASLRFAKAPTRALLAGKVKT